MLSWCCWHIERAKITVCLMDNVFCSRYGKHHIIERLIEWKKRLSDVAAFSVAPVPLVYTQVVHLAIYVFFLVSLVSDQFIIWRTEGDEEPHILVPIFTMFKFLFIFGEGIKWVRGLVPN